MRNRTFTLALALLVAVPVFGQTSAVVPAGSRYVAMGSSFAAGPGVPFQQETCGRSDHNYPHLVAEALQLELVDVSCSGATTDHILHTPQGNEPLQIAAVTADTALVTITIGGNDIEYTRSTFACAGTPAADHCSANLDHTRIEELVSALPGKLGAVVDAIRAIAPNATIVYVTYPRVFTEDAATCSELDMSAEDKTFMGRLGQQLEDNFVNVSATKQTLIADSYVLAAGHGTCAPVSERWVNGNTVVASGARYHPTAEGHAAMAALVQDALQAQ
jgi:lysophospholipase L1-like esterase